VERENTERGDIFLEFLFRNKDKLQKKYSGLPLPKINSLLESEIHEERMTGAFFLGENILVKQTRKRK
jgi:hypothetical protein